MGREADRVGVRAFRVDDLSPTPVCAGIERRDFPRTPFAGSWVIDFAPGSEWPSVDHHETEERYFVLSGEIIDDDVRYGAGTYVMFEAGSEHRPRSEIGGRMLGISQVQKREPTIDAGADATR